MASISRSLLTGGYFDERCGQMFDYDIPMGLGNTPLPCPCELSAGKKSNLQENDQIEEWFQVYHPNHFPEAYPQRTESKKTLKKRKRYSSSSLSAGLMQSALTSTVGIIQNAKEEENFGQVISTKYSSNKENQNGRDREKIVASKKRRLFKGLSKRKVAAINEHSWMVPCISTEEHVAILT
mmetsp:Transcript_37748/g.55621  ORF Transcript_37748/g.55621 Transcript_37748/m.55621 type:complete len:181 (+) Transcript_37748:514-1056(+)|eukprot:CAMPEP_0195517726 /NCGR_PEP_ID=MMETSP0794_2-20130614/11480_1 /TAXON_ID=515487 /ORGANISM="Stephanopyxis turris, Strain CCMP 815" /LENGTH=180 /DNA_ID=CAMNT_0040646593 /DNA_START=500 /DNA_END=1042 /DNA_ORIENTATION=+